jgi:polysaccharide deacetylase family protein (PEP-CTERM system associated)
MWALEILAESGMVMDSSIVPIGHDRYGVPGYPRFPSEVETKRGVLLEVPVATIELRGLGVVPVGGGGYLRMLPYRYTAAGLRRLNEQDARPGCVYFHPWEVDQEQPRIADGALSRLRTYLGLGGMMGKLERLLDEFEFSTMGAVYGKKESA